MVIGFALLLFSFLGGAGDTGDVGGVGDVGDVGHDIGHDFGGGMDAPGLSPLSLPMISAFMGITGAMGSALSYSGWDSTTTAAFSVFVGFLGFGGLFIVVSNFLVKAQSSSTIHEKEYEGKTATVTDAIPENGIGGIALSVRGIRQSVSARSNGPRIPVGTSVLVTRIQDSVAFVEELREPAKTGE
jgi:membrane protein implicated in regulation of membrane protease activity